MAGEIVVAKVAGYGFKVAGIVRNVARTRWSADKRLADAVAREIEDEVLSAAPELKRRISQLEADGKRPSRATVAMVFEAFAKSRVQAEGNKRKLLLNALRNAFDPELYEASMTNTLFGIIDALDYGDLAYLLRLADAVAASGIKDQRGVRIVGSAPIGYDVPTPWRDISNLDPYHATRLLTHGLLHRRRNRPDQPGDGVDDAAVVTGLGFRMTALIRDPESEEKA